MVGSEGVGAEASLPLVTIGMPTRNGAGFIGQSIEALLSQDYPNFQILISDNCSTDATESIAREWVARDSRITYFRQPSDIGAVANFNYVLHEAAGEYFIWAADHDLWAPNHLSTCVAALEANPGAVLAYPGSNLIDADGRVVSEMDDQLDVDQESALERYKRLVWLLDNCNMIYGVGRRSAFEATGGFPDVISPDHLVLARMALQGPIVRVGGHLYLRRQNRPPETVEENRRRSLSELSPATSAGRVESDAARLYRELRDLHVRAVWASTLSFDEKLEATLATLASFRDRFGVRSIPLGLTWQLAALTGQRARFDRRVGIRP